MKNHARNEEMKQRKRAQKLNQNTENNENSKKI